LIQLLIRVYRRRYYRLSSKATSPVVLVFAYAVNNETFERLPLGNVLFEFRELNNISKEYGGAGDEGDEGDKSEEEEGEG
jgi:hypothetical protein